MMTYSHSGDTTLVCGVEKSVIVQTNQRQRHGSWIKKIDCNGQEDFVDEFQGVSTERVP